MKKEEIRVTIDSLEKQQKAIEILNRYNEPIWGYSSAMDFDEEQKHLCVDTQSENNEWWIQEEDCNDGWKNRTEITLDELETILKNESNHS
jgi:hypothetical protein